VLVLIGFNAGLCAPAQNDGNLIHSDSDRDCTNRPHPHHDFCRSSVARRTGSSRSSDFAASGVV